MSPETEEHKRIKEIILGKLKEAYGSGLKEYPDSGNISDVFTVTNDGIEIFIETVWTPSKNNFYRDLHTLRNSLADVKIFIVNPKILKNDHLTREYEKVKFSERKRGTAISDLIDGSLILTNPDYINNKFEKTINELTLEAKNRKKPSQATPKFLVNHSKRILLTRSDYQGLNNWARETLLINLLRHGKDRLETVHLMQHFETGYHDEIWVPLMEYRKIAKKFGYLTIPCLGPKGFTNSIKKMPKNTEKRMFEIQKHVLQEIDKIIFAVENGLPLDGWCDLCSEK